MDGAPIPSKTNPPNHQRPFEAWMRRGTAAGTCFRRKPPPLWTKYEENHLPGKQDHNSKFAQRKTRRRNYPQWIHWEQLFGLRRIYFLTGQMSMASASAGIKKRYEMGVINPRLKVPPVSASAKTEVTGLVETSYALYTPCPYQHSHADEHLKCWSCKLPALACCKCLRKTTMAHVFLLITGMEKKKKKKKNLPTRPLNPQSA